MVGVHFFDATPVFVLGEEALLFAGDHERRVTIHAGAILASASDGTRIVTGGDDGSLVETGVDGEHRVLASDDKKRWIDLKAGAGNPKPGQAAAPADAKDVKKN